MKSKNEVFPFMEREDYSLSCWINDTLNLIKNRSVFIDKKEQAFLVFVDNAAEFVEMYCEGASPREAFNDFEGVED